MTLTVRNIDRPELSFEHRGVDQAYVNRAITFLSQSSIYKLVIKAKQDRKPVIKVVRSRVSGEHLRTTVQ